MPCASLARTFMHESILNIKEHFNCPSAIPPAHIRRLILKLKKGTMIFHRPFLRKNRCDVRKEEITPHPKSIRIHLICTVDVYSLTWQSITF